MTTRPKHPHIRALDCALCSDLVYVHDLATAALVLPLTHVNFAGYRRWLGERLLLHVTARHAPTSVPLSEDDAQALDREDIFMKAMTGEIRRVLDQVHAAARADLSTNETEKTL